MELWEKHNYLNKDILSLKSVVIREYDMRDAGFSIIKNNSVLDSNIINELEKYDKYKRNVKIGLILRDNSEASKFIINEFIKIRKNFIISNDLKESDILSIKKDAIFVINKVLKNTLIDNYEWKNKNKYSSYFYLNKKEFYYSSWNNYLEIKGIGKEIIELQDLYFIKDIKNLIRSYEILDNERLVKVLKSYRKRYLNYELPLEHYRELNSNSMFKLKSKICGNSLFSDSINNINEIDISYNYINFILPLISIMV